MTKIPVKDVPNEQSIFRYVSDQFNYKEAIADCKPSIQYQDFLCFKIKDWDADKMRDCVNEICQIYGEFGWVVGGNENKDSIYKGFSLVYNPNLKDKSMDINGSTFGSTDLNYLEIKQGAANSTYGYKNSYLDSHGFWKPTPASQHGYLGEFLTRSKAQRIRSRVGIIHGELADDSHSGGWHIDEPIFQNLRINIPVTTNEAMWFQFEHKKPVHLDIGWAYSFDSYVPHRVFTTEKTDFQRIHLVLGYSPWFDYDEAEDAWYPNEFFGKKHPYDMLVDGDIIDGLEFDPNKELKTGKLLLKHRWIR
jgi:hypothetical protein